MTEYFGNVLSSFENGAQMELTLKLAIEFLKANPRTGPAADNARYALTLANEL